MTYLDVAFFSYYDSNAIIHAYLITTYDDLWP